jgi:hypothetical protein
MPYGRELSLAHRRNTLIFDCAARKAASFSRRSDKCKRPLSPKRLQIPIAGMNFGTFGIHLSYDIFDGGKRRALVRERSEEISAAEEDLERIKDQIQVRVSLIYNRLETTRAWWKFKKKFWLHGRKTRGWRRITLSKASFLLRSGMPRERRQQRPKQPCWTRLWRIY